MKLPNILSFPIYALDLSDQSYKYLCLREESGGVAVSDFGEGDIPDGVIEQGEIKKPDMVSALLKNLFNEHHMRFVAISLPEERGFLRPISLFGIKQDEVGEALGYQLEEYIPLNSAETVFDYTVIATEKDYIDVVVSAFPRHIVESYTDLVSGAGALPVCVESEITSAFRAIIPTGYLETAMIIDWGRTRTSFSIVEGGALRFASTASIGGKALSDAIAKSLGIDNAHADELKRKVGFVHKAESVEVFNAIVPVVTAIKEEAEKYINFWQSHSKRKTFPKKIFLSGGDANLLGLTDYFAREFGTEVELANPWVNVPFPPRYIPDIELKDSLRFAATIGLGIRSVEEGKIL